MFKKKWYSASKGSKKKEKQEEVDEGDFGSEFLDEEFEADSAKRVLPPPLYKGPNSVTFQLSGPRSFAVVGRNKTIRDAVKKMVGSRHRTITPSFMTFPQFHSPTVTHLPLRTVDKSLFFLIPNMEYRLTRSREWCIRI